MKRKILLILFIFVISNAFSQAIKPKMNSDELKRVRASIEKKLGKYPLMFEEWKSESERKVKLDRVSITPGQNRIHLYFNSALGQISMREETIQRWEQMVRDTLGKGYEDSRVQLYVSNVEVEKLIPNYFREKFSKDKSRKKGPTNQTPLVQNIDRPVFGKGLAYKQIALWPSHGKYYDAKKDKWQWQRPALFCSMEDLNSFEYTYHYLIPMLENAGATIISPRERDPNPNEFIFDENKAVILSGDWQIENGGFKQLQILRDENPFEEGSHLSTKKGGSVEYAIGVPLDEYAIYVSYQPNRNASSKVTYKVRHAGGDTEYRINQQIGSGWIYLGTHIFDNQSKVVVHAQGQATTDAIRLGGGVGNVERAGQLSGVPRWAEGARYYMQYSGVPSRIYSQDTAEKNEPSDYTDDFKGRGEWAYWLQNECNIPLDLVVAIHTNAGINDTIFGTLTINHSGNFKEKYKDGTSKLAGRDLADIVLTQIVNDIRAKYTKQWTRRSLYDRRYREAMAPDSPAVLIELLSHQNMNDMVYGLDPQFRFDASRAIYKGILRFISERYDQPYVVQPLPPTNFTMSVEDNKLCMRWDPQEDELEPTAKPDYYILYTRVGKGGFNNGIIIRSNEVKIPIVKSGKITSYKVTAANEGGESFPTEVLSACFLPGTHDIALIVNEYNKLMPPDTVKGGINLDRFIPYKHDYGIVGKQINFKRSSEFIDNENPGWGASTKELITIGVRGNDFDHTVAYGEILSQQGYSYISTSLKGFDKKIHEKFDRVVRIRKPNPGQSLLLD